MNNGYPELSLIYLEPCDGELECREVPEGSFCIQLPTGFSIAPDVRQLSQRMCGFRYDGRSEAEWVSIVHFSVPEGHEGDNLESWVDVDVEILGKPPLHSSSDSDNVEYDLLRFEKIRATDVAFKARHHADAMVSYVGTIRRRGIVCRLFILCLRRGQDAWKVEYVFPARMAVHTRGGECDSADAPPLGLPQSEDVPLLASREEMQRAGMVLGNFQSSCHSPNGIGITWCEAFRRLSLAVSRILWKMR